MKQSESAKQRSSTLEDREEAFLLVSSSSSTLLMLLLHTRKQNEAEGKMGKIDLIHIIRSCALCR